MGGPRDRRIGGSTLPGVEADLRRVAATLEPAPGPALGVALAGVLLFEQRNRAPRDRLIDLTRAALHHIDGHDDFQEAHLRGYLAWVVGMVPDAAQEALDLFDEALRWAEDHREPNAVRAILINRTDYRFALGLSRAALEAGRRTLEMAERWPIGGSMHDYVAGNFADAALVTGDWDAGIAALQESFLVDQANVERAANYSLLGLLHLARGDVAAAIAPAAESRDRRGTTQAERSSSPASRSSTASWRCCSPSPTSCSTSFGARQMDSSAPCGLRMPGRSWTWPPDRCPRADRTHLSGSIPPWKPSGIEARARPIGHRCCWPDSTDLWTVGTRHSKPPRNPTRRKWFGCRSDSPPPRRSLVPVIGAERGPCPTGGRGGQPARRRRCPEGRW